MEVLLDDLTKVIRDQRIIRSFLMKGLCAKCRYNWLQSVMGLLKYLIAIENRFSLGVYEFEFKYMLVICIMYLYICICIINPIENFWKFH